MTQINPVVFHKHLLFVLECSLLVAMSLIMNIFRKNEIKLAVSGDYVNLLRFVFVTRVWKE